MKEKNILRISKDKENPYVMINKNVMQDERLSWKARGLMGYLLSLPDDWVLYTEELEKHSEKDGRESLASGIKELIKYGYIAREQAREKKGSFGLWTYVVVEAPPSTENGFPESGLPENGKPATTNTHCTNKDLTKRKYKKKDSPRGKTAPISGKYDSFYL